MSKNNKFLSTMFRHFIFLALLYALTTSARGEAMLQYFNTSWVEITNKMPELAEAGYSSLWLPPPTKGSGGLSVGYDLWDPFDLGGKNQRNSVRTRYGTEAELIRLVETAHRFGIRVYFDNIMNHRAFDVPGFNENTPIDIYPGMVPEDFHLRRTQDGFYRKWDNTRSWTDAWQVQHLGLADLIDIAQEPGTTNQNFGLTEGSTALKIKFIRDYDRPEQYYFDKNGNYIGFGGLLTMARQPANLGLSATDAQARAWAQSYLNANKAVYEEYVENYLNRAARWLMDRTKADGLRLDAVKHIRADFFGATFGAGKDSSDYGYSGQVQRQFNISRGFSDTNHRDTVFSTDAGRDDAMLFGEHLGEPPAYGPFVDSGMRLVDNDLRSQLNSRLGNPSSGLQGYDWAGVGGFAANIGVTHAQSHDSDYAARRELQHAFYFLRDGLGLLYTDGNYQAETLGESGGAFPRHSNTSFLGQWADGRVPNLLYVHEQFARGYQLGRFSDADVVVWERLDKRENGSMSDADAVSLLVMLSDNYGSGQARGFTSAFPTGAYLYNYSWYGGGFFKFKEELSSTVLPAGGYFLFSWKNPDPSELWANHGGRPITITENGVEAKTVTVRRRDGPNGDKAFNGGTLPDASRPILPADTNVTDYTYSAVVPRVTSSTGVRFLARVDGSAENVLMKLDGGIDLNGTVPLGVTDPALRDRPPAVSNDMFLGYEQPNFISRIHPELFAAKDTARNSTGSAGAETFTTTTVVNGTSPKFIDTNTASFLYHDPAAPVGNLTPARNQYDASRNEMWVKTNSVGGGYKSFLYYTTDGSNPEGSAGRGAGTTKVVEMSYRHNDDGGSTNWWSATPLPADFTVTSKYKIAIHKEAAPSWWPGNADAVTRKKKMQTTFETNALAMDLLPVRPHNDYGVTQTGLSEGMHVIRARAFLSRAGKASIYNTFTQSFYYDASRPLGEVRFPENNGDTVGGSEYGLVIRTDSSVTEVWYNIADSDASNNDSVTRSQNGNGGGFEPFKDANRNGNRDAGETFTDLDEDGVWDASLPVSWVRATEVTPTNTPTNANYVKEWRFTYANIPATGTAAINVRLREISSAAYKDFNLSDTVGHYTTLVRTVNVDGPDNRMFVAWPPNDEDAITTGYVMKVYFSKDLATGLTEQQLIDRFTIRIGSNETGNLSAYPRDTYDIVYDETSDYHALAFPLPNIYNDQPDYIHRIQITLDRSSPNPDVTATRLVKAEPSFIPRITIATPPELDQDGKPYEVILPDVANPTAEQRQFVIRVTTSAAADSVMLTVNNGPMTINMTPVTTVEGGSKHWDYTWSGITQGEFRFTAKVFDGPFENHEVRNVRVFFRQRTSASASDPDDDDDGLLDADEGTATPLPSGFPADDPRFKPNSEQWTNGEVHIYNAFGKTDPRSPDTDSDGLPDALEVGWRLALTVGEAYADTGFGLPVVGAGNGVFDWTDANTNGQHDVGEASETFTDSDGNNKFDFGTILTTDTNGDGSPNFRGDLDPPFFNTLDNLNKVPGVNTAAEGGDRARLLRGSMTDPDDADSDNDGLRDGIEDANKNGWLDGDGASLAANAAPTLARSWPNKIRDPAETWTETDPNNPDTDGDGARDGSGEDINGDGIIEGDSNNNRVWNAGEIWTETDPLKADTDGDGLPDGWEVRYGIDPLISGLVNLRGGAPVIDDGATGNPDGDAFNNLAELTNGTNPRENNNITPPPPGQIRIGPQSPIVAGGVSNSREFTDWAIEDLIMLDEYNGDGTNNQGTDIFRNADGFDSSRDIVAFYAHDGGPTANGGDDLIYFRIDFQDLVAFAENGGVDAYVVIDFNSPSSGEAALPDEIDTLTNMKWEVCVATYSTDNGAVYVDTNAASNSISINQSLTPFGVVRRDQNAANGFKRSWYSSTMDAVEFSISRQALIDAGWNGNANTLNYQVFTTKDGTNNGPSPARGAGDLGDRSDIRDSILDDWIASDHWRAQPDIRGAGSVLKAWFGPTNTNNDLWKRAKVVSLMHESRPLMAGNEVQALINNGAGAGWHRPLDVHDAYDVPMALHITPLLASAIQWAKVDPAVNKPWRDGPSFNSRVGTLAAQDHLDLIGTTYSDHILPYFPLTFTQTNIADANTMLTEIYGASPSGNVLYPSERVLNSATFNLISGSGFSFTFADQTRHIEKWFGRSASLSNDGYRINRIHGVKTFVLNDNPGEYRFQTTDGGLNTSLRQLFNRKARSSSQDQVVILPSDWTDFTSKTNADGYDANIAWIASHPWIQLTTPDAIAAGQVDSNRDGTPEAWPFIERGTPVLPMVSKDFVHYASQENYDNWFFGQALREESLRDKIFNLRSAAPLPAIFGQVGVSGLAHTAWTSANSLTNPLFGRLARQSFHGAMWLTAFHDQANPNTAKFSTGEYIFPDSSFNNLAGFSKAAQSQFRWAAVYQRVSQWAGTAATLSNSASATQEDTDLDGENEYLLFNDRIFAQFERIGGRMTCAFVRDLNTGRVLQTVGNPHSYSGFETEDEGNVNVVAGNVGSYRTSGFKDWYAAGPNSIAYTNDLYTVTTTPGGFTFTSADGMIAKTITLAARANTLRASVALTGTVTPLYQRHGLSPHLQNLLSKGQNTLGTLFSAGGLVSLTNSASDGIVRTYVKAITAATHVTGAIDDEVATPFDTLNMRNQAQTQQVEFALTNGATFDLGFETGPTLSESLDGDTLPDAWESANGLSNNDPLGVNGDSGNADTDRYNNLEEYILGLNASMSDLYQPVPVKIPGGFEVTFPTIPNRWYRVFASDNLTSWTAITTDQLGTGSSMVITDLTSNPARFYKVEVRLP
jgi:glycosidase